MALHLRGTVLPEDVERDLFVLDGGRLAFDPPPGQDATTVATGGFVLPGLVDVHAHLATGSPAPDGSSPDTIARASARVQLDAGVLAIREPGSPTVPSRGIGSDEGLPRVITAGRFLCTPGRYFAGAAVEVPAQELAEAALAQLRGSDGWVKVIGDWVDPADGVWRPTFPPDALDAAAGSVHRAGGRIAIHAADHRAIEGAVEARFDSIEHGLGLTDDQLERMAERDIALVPTMSVMPLWTGLVEMVGSPRSEVERAAAAVERHPAMVRSAAEAGVLVLAGTDAGVVPHGTVAAEIRLIAATGVPADAAVAAGSWAARRFLRLPAIEDGAPADLTVYDRDPRDDPDALTSPVLVMLNGAIARR